MPKRNKTTNRVKGQPTTKTRGPSKYAMKVRRGKRMYGPGCCAHKAGR
jgi:hypothetical protein